MKNFKLLFGLYITSLSFLFISCAVKSHASLGHMDITADSKKHDINANRSILVKKDIDNKEYRIELIFSPGCEQIGKEQFAFNLRLGGRPQKEIDHNYSFLYQLTLYKEDRTEVDCDDNLLVSRILVSNTSVFFLSYKKMDEVYATKFNDETFEPFQIVHFSYWEGVTSGGSIYLNGENNKYNE